MEPADKNKFDVFIFGGILGDHPPRDRTKVLRDLGFELRGLGKIQLSTDTAVLMTNMILEAGFNFEDIPTIEDPEVVNEKQTVLIYIYIYN